MESSERDYVVRLTEEDRADLSQVLLCSLHCDRDKWYVWLYSARPEHPAASADGR